MPALILTIAGWFGISPFRLIAYAVLAFGIMTAALAIRHHYVQAGWDAALVAVRKQDAIAANAASAVQATADKCGAENGWWDVITQRCQTEEAKP